MSMNFGPLSNQGGERRLNVLITRAKTRCEVFSSITASDIDLTRATGRGPQALKTYLEYAQHGTLADIGDGAASSSPPLEQTLADALRRAGFRVEQRVGVAGFFVDLAVRDPHRDGAFVLGVECDGPLYAAARSARDRDRTRPFVLADRGWRMQRVWSIDYFNRPQEQLRHVLAAVQSPAVAARAAAPKSFASDAPVVEREDVPAQRGGDPDAIAVPYREARFRVPATREIPEVPVDKLAAILAKIIEIEGPIHGDEVAERVRQLWDAARLGPRMLRAIEVALEWAVRTNQAYRDGDYYQRSTDAPTLVRDRSEVESSSLRSPDMLPPAETRECIVRVLRANFGASRDETLTAVARTLGFKSVTAPLRDAIDRQVTDLLKSRTIIEENDRLRAA
jgi:very-short-patch-repair endonuclease